MKYADLDLRELLDFRDGLIQFAGDRSLILSADVLGILRKELTYILGPRVTMGLIMRMGFAHGWVTAERIARDLPWDSEDEWRKAGGKIHALQGHVVAEIPPWRGEGSVPFAHSVWRDSFEAEQHLRHLGQAEEPTCWMLSGFVSGYLSQANGRRILARELTCRGRGDSVCYMEARSEEEWGADCADLIELLDSPCLEQGLAGAGKAFLEVERQIQRARRAEREARFHGGRIIAKSVEMRRVIDVARRVARVDSTVLLIGESGAGKERVAQLIHAESERGHGPFLAVNCGAVTESLLESELFGHARGAFTGATQDRTGLFEAARGGTLFLDEVGELPSSMQVKLLRVLQEREVRRVGENRARSVDVRLIAATNRDLAWEVEAGSFRQDLYYRLKVILLPIPSLRERKDDILPLARFFLEKLVERLGREDLTGLEPGAADLLLAHDWPGNVRELENAVEHAVVLAPGPRITAEDLPLEVRSSTGPTTRPGLSLEAVEKAHVLATLAANDGNRTRTAEQLGIGQATLYRKIQKYASAATGG